MTEITAVTFNGRDWFKIATDSGGRLYMLAHGEIILVHSIIDVDRGKMTCRVTFTAPSTWTGLSGVVLTLDAEYNEGVQDEVDLSGDAYDVAAWDRAIKAVVYATVYHKPLVGKIQYIRDILENAEKRGGNNGL